MYSDDDDDLPFPEPLPRSAFLASDFTPSELLSSLTSRHQTLYDLRTELTQRSQQIASELETLVNNEYQSFLGLGADLKGGEEKVQEIKLGVLGYVKGVEGVRNIVRDREQNVRGLLKERQSVRKDVGYAQALLSVSERVAELEVSLALREGIAQDWSEEEDDDDDDAEEEDDLGAVLNLTRLKRLVQEFLSTKNQIERLGGSAQPFLAKLEERLQKIRQTLLIDLGTALKQAKALSIKGSGRLVKILALYNDMNEPTEAMKILKQLSGS